MQKRRHHFVPKAYLKSFVDTNGRLLVYRKDDPGRPLSVAPDATQFRSYYYSQPLPDGGIDNNKLEDFFSTIESPWPDIVSRMRERANINDSLESIFSFIALQRARVPAARDLAEAMMAASVKSTMRVMLASGNLPPPPGRLGETLDGVEVAIDPHQSIWAMRATIDGMASLFNRIGIAAVHNLTKVPFLTSDNPVIWFDPSIPFEKQRPYTIDPEGPLLLAVPITPQLALIGSNEYKNVFGRLGLQHADTADEPFVEMINAQICRFAYEAVIAQGRGAEDVIGKYSSVSPIHEATPLVVGKGELVIHRQTFGPRSKKPKWK
ncbi:DUF4238 domain-containing protein [Cupriavidus sp. IK-TO18]|uniref:DUF4238 domain-containing protein n=1 Tax=Cupriavidus sp. IK-TO18 TaxID=2782182 RepID=UPI001898B9ED|nr:DUF4238 domain-containing protein [Cupriavidus sp. IK-TO18]MBF6989416.1 DUF4238 domain-containing protein [Cupriavidus sp. IK-TO18]